MYSFKRQQRKQMGLKMEYALIMTSLVIVPATIMTGFIIYIEATR